MKKKIEFTTESQSQKMISINIIPLENEKNQNR